MERQKQNAERCCDDDSNGREPTHGEGLIQHRGRPIELRSRREQKNAKDRKEAHFAIGEALGEGKAETRDRERKREPPRAVASIQQAAGQEKEYNADQSAEKVRGLHRPDGEMRREDDQAPAERRCRPRDEQHDACREGQDSDEDRRQASGDAGEALVGVPPARRHRDSELEESKQASGNDERQHVVDAAIRQQRRRNGV